MSAAPTRKALVGLPVRRTMKATEAAAFLGGRQVIEDAMTAGLLKPCCKPSGKHQTFFSTVDVIALESDILAGRYPVKGGPR